MLYENKVKYVKYAVAIASLASSYFNLVEHMNIGSDLFTIFYYSGSLFIMAVVLAVIPGQLILAAVFVFAGLMMLYDSPEPSQLSSGITMFIFAGALIKNLYARASLYSLMILAVVYKHIIHHMSATSIMNNLVGYIVVFILAEMLFNKDDHNEG